MSRYADLDWSTYRPSQGPGTWRMGGMANEAGPSRAQREFAKGADAWEAFLRQGLADAYEGKDYHHRSYHAGSYKPWYRDQLRELEDWRTRQRESSVDQKIGSQGEWSEWASQYENQMQNRWNEMSGRFDDAFTQLQQPKYYNIGGQQMTAEQAMNQFYKSGQRRDAGFQDTISRMNEDWQRQFDDSRRGVTGQIADLSKGWQRQFDNATYWANQERRGVEGAATVRGLRNFRLGGGGLRGGMNREGMRITNLNV